MRSGLTDFGKHDVTALDVPAQHDLRRRAAGLAGDRRRAPRRRRSAPCAIGDQASVTIAVLAAVGVDLGVLEVRVQLDLVDRRDDARISAASRSRCATWKFETPIERARPSRWNSSSVRHVDTKSPS